MFNFNDIFEKANYCAEGFPLEIHDIKIGKTFGEGKNKKTRIYFTQLSKYNSNIRILKCIDLPWKSKEKELKHIELFTEKDLDHKMTISEKKLNERAGIYDYGVSDYYISTSLCGFMVLGNGYFFSFSEDPENKDSKVSVERKDIPYTLTKIFMCPTKCSLFSFISGPDIYVNNSLDDNIIKITDHDPENAENIYSGLPSPMIQQEFRHFSGMFWCPKIKKDEGKTSMYLLFETVDQTEVEYKHISSIRSMYKPENIKFPRPGKRNAKSKLSIVEIDVSKDKSEKLGITSWDHYKLKGCHDLEYLVNVGWTPDGDYIFAEFISRSQTNKSLFLIPFEAFREEGDEEETSMKLPIVRIIFENVPEDSWINVFKYLHFLGTVKDSENQVNVQFLYASQVDTEDGNLTGFLYSATWSLKSNSGYKRDEFIEANVKREFEVSPKNCNLLDSSKFFYDAEDEIVYYNAFYDHSIVLSVLAFNLKERDIYRLTEKQEIPYILERLSFQLLNYCQENKLFIISSSSMVKTPSIEVGKLEKKDKKKMKLFGVINSSMTIEQIEIGRDSNRRLNFLRYPKFIEKKTKVYEHHGILFEPTVEQRLKVNDKYPTVHLVYPGVKIISTVFNKQLIMKAQLFTHFGFSVFVCDTRGSNNMGMRQAKQIKYKLGDIDLQDQIQFMEYASLYQTKIDMDRLAIVGYYYGGFISLMAACKFCPSFYKCCVATAPIVDWLYHNNIFTERYLGPPGEDQKSGPYFECSPLSYMNIVKKDMSRLLLAHGERDEDVLFYHTSKLIHEFNKHGKPYNFKLYPISRHRLKHDQHYLASAISFIYERLKPPNIEKDAE